MYDWGIIQTTLVKCLCGTKMDYLTVLHLCENVCMCDK